MSSFSADALTTDIVGMAFLAETIDADPRPDDAFAKAFDPSTRAVAQAISRKVEPASASILLQHELA